MLTSSSTFSLDGRASHKLHARNSRSFRAFLGWSGFLVPVLLLLCAYHTASVHDDQQIGRDGSEVQRGSSGPLGSSQDGARDRSGGSVGEESILQSVESSVAAHSEQQSGGKEQGTKEGDKSDCKDETGSQNTGHCLGSDLKDASEEGSISLLCHGEQLENEKNADVVGNGVIRGIDIKAGHTSSDLTEGEGGSDDDIELSPALDVVAKGKEQNEHTLDAHAGIEAKSPDGRAGYEQRRVLDFQGSCKITPLHGVQLLEWLLHGVHGEDTFCSDVGLGVLSSSIVGSRSYEEATETEPADPVGLTPPTVFGQVKSEPAHLQTTQSSEGSVSVPLSDSETEPRAKVAINADTEREARPVRARPPGLDEYKKSLSEQVWVSTPNESTYAVPASNARRNSADGSLYNYAAAIYGAKVVAANKEAMRAGAVLDEDKDKYMRSPCSVEKKFIVIQLSETLTRVESIVLGNYEFYSSTMRSFELYGAFHYPSDEWIYLGNFTAQNVRTPQTFEVGDVESRSLIRYVRLNLLTHHGSEFFCTLSVVRVHGVDELESIKEEMEAMRQEVEESDFARRPTPVPVTAAGNVLSDLDIAEAAPRLSAEGDQDRPVAAAEHSLPEGDGNNLGKSSGTLDIHVSGGAGSSSGAVSAETPVEGTVAGSDNLSERVTHSALVNEGNNPNAQHPVQTGSTAEDELPPAGGGGASGVEINRRDTETPLETLGQQDAASQQQPIPGVPIHVGEKHAASSPSATSNGNQAHRPNPPQPLQGSQSQSGHSAHNGGSTGRSGGDFVFKALMNKVRGLELNQSLLDRYVDHTVRTQQEALSDMDTDLAALREKVRNVSLTVADVAFRLLNLEEERSRQMAALREEVMSRHEVSMAEVALMRLQLDAVEKREQMLLLAIITSLLVGSFISCLSLCSKPKQVRPCCGGLCKCMAMGNRAQLPAEQTQMWEAEPKKRKRVAFSSYRPKLVIIFFIVSALSGAFVAFLSPIQVKQGSALGWYASL